ncbi:MAG: glycyl-radical enzyme activating protein [Desulfobacterales bacterium]|nr:glycyl-radical enzyme activating protein [Desulfobacterales bacterium]
MNNTRDDMIRGTVLEIQRMSTEDGPGIRTTVFLKGCSLKCAWCHNPESIKFRPQVHWVGVNCLGCGTCVETCGSNAVSLSQDGVEIDRELCSGCGDCADQCPAAAMELLGKKWSPGDLIDEVAKDKAYFGKSGGVTLSGGEAALQPDFVVQVLKGLAQKGIHTAVDTSGQCPGESLAKLLPHADMVLFDLKEIDPDYHKKFTSCSNKGILENLKFVSEFIRSNEKPAELWVRTPIIPDATAREENILGIGRFIASHLYTSVKRWELCAFNNLCRDKYTRLGLHWIYRDSDLLTRERMVDLASAAENSGVDPEIVRWSGETKGE